MVATVDRGRSVLFRVGAPLVLVTTFGALLAWGYTGQTASELRSPKAATTAFATSQIPMTPVSFRGDAPVAEPTFEPSETPPPVERQTIEQARRIAAKFARGSLGMIQVVDTDTGPAIVAINNQRKAGKSTFFVLEKRAGKYRMSAQGSLDTEGFRHASWSSELVDADEDGYEELLFSGKDSDQSRTLRRLILFVPNAKRTYSMQMTGETTARGTPRIQWLSNAAGTDAAAYRTALRKKARAIVARNR
jgi:hypothetical protein